MMSPRMTSTLMELSQNSSSPKYLIPNQLMTMIVTRKIAIQTPGLTLSAGSQY